VVLRDGRIVEHGTFRTLVERPGVFQGLCRIAGGLRAEDGVAIP